MATFRFRSNRWQARVRRQGHPDETRSFLTHKEAERWARTVESGIDHGSFRDWLNELKMAESLIIITIRESADF
tara:strand:+ start:31 stop:252 length:222 start_codon:yes stop_codon:yes gene_type:complete